MRLADASMRAEFPGAIAIPRDITSFDNIRPSPTEWRYEDSPVLGIAIIFGPGFPFSERRPRSRSIPKFEEPAAEYQSIPRGNFTPDRVGPRVSEFHRELSSSDSLAEEAALLPRSTAVVAVLLRSDRERMNYGRPQSSRL